MKILVTGVSGYIGRYVASLLQERGYEVTAFIKSGEKLSAKHLNSFQCVEGDLLKRETIETAVKGCNVVVHLAAVVGSPDRDLNMRVNYEGTKHLIEMSQKNQISRFIYMSSISAARKEKGPYGISKLKGEELVLESGIPYTIFRPTMVYGRESMGLYRIIKNIKRFPFVIPMIGRGKYLRQPVYVMDVADVIERSIRNHNVINRSYYLGGGESLTFFALVRKISAILGVEKLIIPIPLIFCRLIARISQMSTSPIFTLEHIRGLSEDTQVDIDPLKKDLGFHPISLDTGLTKVIHEIYHQ